MQNSNSGNVHLFRYWLEIPFLGKCFPKNQKSQFILKFGTCTNYDMQNSMAMFILLILDSKYPFFGKFGRKNQNCQFKLKFGI